MVLGPTKDNSKNNDDHERDDSEGAYAIDDEEDEDMAAYSDEEESSENEFNFTDNPGDKSSVVKGQVIINSVSGTSSV